MNHHPRSPKWPFFVFSAGLILLVAILLEVWEFHHPAREPICREAEQLPSPARSPLEFPDTLMDFPVKGNASQDSTVNGGFVFVSPAEKILAEMSGERLEGSLGDSQFAGERNLVPQAEVVGDFPALIQDPESVSPTKKQGESSSQKKDDSGPKSGPSAGQERLATRPKRLEALPEETLPEPQAKLEEDSSLSPNPLGPAPPAPRESPGAKSDYALTKKAWTDPEALRKSLEELAATAECATWANQALKDLQVLGAAMEDGSPEARAALGRLSDAVASVPKIVQKLNNFEQVRKVRQAGYALQRRIDVWQSILQLGPTALIEAECPAADPRKVALCLVDLDSVTSGSKEGRHWREYLLTDALKELVDQRRQKNESRSPSRPHPSSLPEGEETVSNSPMGEGTFGERQQRELAQKILARLIATPTTDPQRQFLNSPLLTTYREQVQRLAAEPIAPADVLSDLERYERTRLGSDGRRVAFALQVLALSPDPRRRAVAEQLDRNYRNANLRITLSEEFLNRLVPESKTEIAPVNERILGTPVYGQSMTSADVAIKLIPDPERAHVEFQMTGEAVAVTSSTSGTATFFHDNESVLAGVKPLEIDRKGLRLLPSKVHVQQQSRLRGLQTNYDRIPLINWIARNIARTQHDQFREEAEREGRQRVEEKTRKRLDTEAYARMSDLVNRLNHNVFGPLDRLALDPTIIDARTTEDRLTLRLRVAGDDQLGSHTPRPQAPTDCLASFQINESMLNNALARLQLEGKTLTLKELAQRIAERFHRPDIWQVPPTNENVQVTFPAQDPLRVRCENGQVILELSIVEFGKPSRSWSNFQVRVVYGPKITGRQVELVREGPIQLIAEGLRLSSRVALSGALAKAFPSDRPVNVTPKRFLNDPKLGDLQVTQLLIDDGWIGVALGTNKQSEQTAMRK
jgi:hypothetical protein